MKPTTVTQLLPLLIVLFVLPMCIPAAEMQLLTVSPRMVEMDEGDLFDKTASGFAIVEIGGKVYLQVTPRDNPADWTNINWSFDSHPINSGAVFQATDTLLNTFQPDKDGEYAVRFTADYKGEPIVLTGTIQAGYYIGAGGLAGELPECALCHSDIAQSWSQTAHASVFQRFLNGEETGQYDLSFFQWHTLGFNQDPLAKNRGFDDKANQLGVDLNGLVDQVEQAYQLRNDSDPANDPDFFAALPRPVRAKANVQCESCHGPGSKHFGTIGTIGNSWSAHNCLTCHDDFEPVAKPVAQDTSGHSTINPLFSDFPGLLKSDCAKCHSAQAFVAFAVENEVDEYLNSEVEPHGITCAACHDPHEKNHAKTLRIQGDITLEGGAEFKDGGRGAMCVVCHESRVYEPLQTYIDSNRGGPHYAPQADVTLGINAWDFGEPYETGESIHKLVVEDTCVACHMADIPENGWTQEEGILLGGHSFKLANHRGTTDPSDDINNLRNSCLPCHFTLTSFDRLTPPGTDYDGDGQREGIQTEVQGLLDQIASILMARYSTLVRHPDGELEVSSQLFSVLSFDEKAVIHNYRLVQRDGSLGIHNPRFAVEVLQRSLNAL